MILLYALAGIVLALNILGRILILRRDQDIPDQWILPLKACPGAELLYSIFRWEKARLGCAVCAISLVASVPVAHQLLVRHLGPDFASFLAPVSVATAASGAQGETMDPAQVRKVLTFKERKIAELGKFLQQWFQTLTVQQGFLCDEMPDELAAYNRNAAAYQSLLSVWKAEQGEVEDLRAQL